MGSPDFEHPYDPDLPDRRAYDPMKEMLRHGLQGMETRLQEHIDNQLKTLKAELTAEFRSAYPNNDPTEHRKAHEAQISSATRWADFRFSLLKHVAGAVVLVALSYAGASIYENFKYGILREQTESKRESK